jgi:riboflavin kinase/FMN adenylyltransferase
VLTGDHTAWAPSPVGAAVAIGVFDGVHLGHRRVLREVGAEAVARDLLLTVLTFDRHPLALIDPARVPPRLSDDRQRTELLAELGVDQVAVLTFDETVRSLEAEAFVRQVLVAGLGARLVAVGRDFRFGRDRAGDVDGLRRLGQDEGFDLMEVELLTNGDTLSSTSIRHAVTAGDLDEAASRLGRSYELRGEVVAGDGRGASIGYPTANLDVDPAMAMPQRGVYAVEVVRDGEAHPGVANIGVRPTFGGEREILEVHLFDFDESLYGERLAVRFVSRLRGEQKFSGIEDLVAQIDRDAAAAASVLGQGSSR